MRGICSVFLAVLTVMTAAPLRAEEEAQAPAGHTKARNEYRHTRHGATGRRRDGFNLSHSGIGGGRERVAAGIFRARDLAGEPVSPDARGPVTRSGHRAEGIAQFMPYTADERGLLDPFNPVAALPKAAEFLRELRAEFGNLGLAAAAYNAGPGRVRRVLDGQ